MEGGGVFGGQKEESADNLYGGQGPGRQQQRRQKEETRTATEAHTRTG